MLKYVILIVIIQPDIRLILTLIAGLCKLGRIPMRRLKTAMDETHILLPKTNKNSHDVMVMAMPKFLY